MKVLKSRLYDLKLKENLAAMDKLGGEKKEIGFGSQIRSYVMQPYQMVKDLRSRTHRDVQGSSTANRSVLRPTDGTAAARSASRNRTRHEYPPRFRAATRTPLRHQNPQVRSGASTRRTTPAW